MLAEAAAAVFFDSDEMEAILLDFPLSIGSFDFEMP